MNLNSYRQSTVLLQVFRVAIIKVIAYQAHLKTTLSRPSREAVGFRGLMT